MNVGSTRPPVSFSIWLRLQPKQLDTCGFGFSAVDDWLFDELFSVAAVRLLNEPSEDEMLFVLL